MHDLKGKTWEKGAYVMAKSAKLKNTERGCGVDGVENVMRRASAMRETVYVHCSKNATARNKW